MRKYTIGEINFWRNLGEYQYIEESNEPVQVITRLVKPINRNVERLKVVIDHWVVVVGVTFGVFTLKILAELLVERMR